jgi:hypothetical protein
MRHSANNEASYTTSQDIAGIVAGTGYQVKAWVNIPPTSDAFRFDLRLHWRNASNTTLSTSLIKSYSTATAGWVEATATVATPTGATNAQLQLVATGLSTTIYVDDVDMQPTTASDPAELTAYTDTDESALEETALLKDLQESEQEQRPEEQSDKTLDQEIYLPFASD